MQLKCFLPWFPGLIFYIPHGGLPLRLRYDGDTVQAAVSWGSGERLASLTLPARLDRWL